MASDAAARGDNLQLLTGPRGAGRVPGPEYEAEPVTRYAPRTSRLAVQFRCGCDFLQRTGLPAQIFDLIRGRRPCGVAGQALLAGLQKFLRPAVIEVLDDPFAAAQLGNAVFAAQTDSTIRIFSSAENWRRVARRIALTTWSAGSFTGPDFCPIFAPSMATMGQKSSLSQLSKSVS